MFRGKVAGKLKLYERALNDFDTALVLAPKSYKVLLGKGQLKQDMSDYFGAIKAYSAALVLEPKAYTVMTARAEAWLGLGEFKKAIVDCNTVLKKKPDMAKAYYIRGMAKLEKNLNDNDGLKDLSEAADKGMFEVYGVMRKVHEKRGKE
jgi:tetratricopeptide (TPR) repeat protein